MLPSFVYEGPAVSVLLLDWPVIHTGLWTNCFGDILYYTCQACVEVRRGNSRRTPHKLFTNFGPLVRPIPVSSISSAPLHLLLILPPSLSLSLSLPLSLSLHFLTGIKFVPDQSRQIS